MPRTMKKQECFQNLESIMPELYMIANELRAETLQSNCLKKDENSTKLKRSEHVSSEVRQTQVFNFYNPTCYICNGYYGPCFEDPTCATCHAFLYPNAAPDVQVLTLLQDNSDDSDSGNDEPADNTDRINAIGENIYVNNDVIFTPPVQVEGLAQQLSKLSVVQHELKVDVEDLPPEVLMKVFNYLDEISLWSVGQVCVRWKEILNMYVRPEKWRNFTLLRWPLLVPICEDQDWYTLYTSLIKSCWCIKCVRQMAAQECPTIEETSWRKHRLRSELRTMRLDPLEGIQAKPLDLLCCHWQATIQGPIGSPYEGGLFYLYIQIPYTYPMCPPVVRFLTKIFHPNVSRHGDIGIDSIHHNWTLALTISKILLSIQSLLTDPYCNVCMEPEVGSLYLRNRQAFEEQARLWTWNYAMHDLQQH